MEPNVVLCADSESIRDPRFVGLEGENLESQEWLRIFCSAVEARNYLKQSKTKEVWVASSDDVDPINLAAALKQDNESKGIYLVAFQGTGSLKSRANAAGIDGMFSQQKFVSRYATCKQNACYTKGRGEHERPTQMDAPEKTRTLDRASMEMSSPIDVSRQSTQVIRAIPNQEEGQNQRFSEISPLPDDVRNAVSSAAIVPLQKKAFVLSVVSASGGSGKSTISALSALFSQGLGYRTLLIDADFQFGDMHHVLGKKESLTIVDLLRDAKLINVLCPEDLQPALLAAPPHLEQGEQVQNAFPQLLETLRYHFDVIVVNTGAFWTDQHAALLEASSTALFVVDQRPSSVRECRHALELCSRCGIASNPFVFAVNHCARNAPLTSIDVSCALQGGRAIELSDGGRDVSDLLAAGLPLDLIESRNSLCMSIERMLLEILPKNENGKKKIIMPKKQRGPRGFGKKRRRVACL